MAGDDWNTGGITLFPTPLPGVGTAAAVASIRGTLLRFGKHPTAFLLGLSLNYVLGGAEAILVSLLDAIWFLFVGDNAGSSEGMWGLEDPPLFLAELLVAIGDTIGSVIVDAVERFTESIASTALLFGDFAPLVIAIEIAVVLIVFYLLVRTVVRVTLDVIPGLGGLIS